MKPRLLEIRQGVLNKNDQLAGTLRKRFMQEKTYVLNVVSSPGAGKTTLLEKTMATLVERGLKVAALVGDLETDNDAQRLANSGAFVRQIVTAGNCHLEADMIQNHLISWDLPADLDFLFIENVGNLVCPANYDLGESLRVVVLSTTEGEDKPQKYPPMFHSSDMAVITKMDIADAVEFDRDAAHASIESVRPGMELFEVSAKTGLGMGAWVSALLEKREQFVSRLDRVEE